MKLQLNGIYLEMTGETYPVGKNTAHVALIRCTVKTYDLRNLHGAEVPGIPGTIRGVESFMSLWQHDGCRVGLLIVETEG